MEVGSVPAPVPAPLYAPLYAMEQHAAVAVEPAGLVTLMSVEQSTWDLHGAGSGVRAARSVNVVVDADAIVDADWLIDYVPVQNGDAAGMDVVVLVVPVLVVGVVGVGVVGVGVGPARFVGVDIRNTQCRPRYLNKPCRSALSFVVCTRSCKTR